MVTTATFARWGAAGFVTILYVDEMQDNYEKGNWLEAAKDTGWYVLAMTPLVAPEFFWGSVAFPVIAGATLGLGVTWLILEVTGIGDAGDVWEIITDPPIGDWGGEWYDVVAPEVKRKVSETYYTTLSVGSLLLNLAAREVQKKKDLVEGLWNELTEYGNWSNPTPGAPWL